jgi:hypothetical protein
MLVAVKVMQSGNRRYIAILALAACFILIVGWLARPREISQSRPPLPSESELAQLARRAERHALESMTRYFAGTAGDVESSVVKVPNTGTSGIVWDERLIVTAPLQRDGSEAVTVATTSGEGRARAMVWGPRLPLSAVETPSGLSGLSPAHRVPSRQGPGDWIVAVWRTDLERAFAPGHFLQLAPVTCGLSAALEVVSSLSLTGAMAGGGLFDIDGNLLAVILPCEGRFVAIAAPSVESILERADTLEQLLLRRYGLVVGALTEDEKTYFKTDHGVIVREVWTGYRGDEVGLVPGDIITALGEMAVADPEDLRVLTIPSDEQPDELALQRGAQELKIALSGPVVAVPQAAPGAGLVWNSPQERYTVDAVIPGSRAAAAGVEPGDRLVRIDHAEPRDLTQVRRILADDKASPVLLEIDRGDHRVGILVR